MGYFANPHSTALTPQRVRLSSGVELEYVERPIQTPVGRTIAGASRHADSPALVCLHGVTDSWRSFEPLFAYLPSTVRVFAISQRGHGESSKPQDGRYTYTQMADDVRSFMDRLELPRAVVIGHSMGSMVAQRFALDYRGRVASLVLIGAFATMFESEAMGEFVATTIAPLGDPIDPTFAREWQLSTTARPLDTTFLDAIVAETLKVPARVWRSAFEEFLRTPDFSSELRTLDVPTLLLWGDRDTYAQRSDQERLAEAIPGVRRLTYEGVGHAVHWEVPERVTADILSFLADSGLLRGSAADVA